MKTLITAVFAAAITLAPAVSFAEDGNSSLRSFKKETAKARAAGGYGNPIVAVPVAVADTITTVAGSVATEVESFASSVSTK